MADRQKPMPAVGSGEPVLAQDPHAAARSGSNLLEESIGLEVRRLRDQLRMTISELARSAGMSGGMLSPGETNKNEYYRQYLAIRF